MKEFLSRMLSVPGFAMFLLGVFLAAWVRSLFSSVSQKAQAA